MAVEATANRRPPNGYPKATALVALVNSGWLLVLSLLVMAGGVDRLTTSTRQVDGLPVLVVSGVAAVVMFAGALVLGGRVDDLDDDDDNSDLNIRSVVLDTAADAASAAGVAITRGIILATGGLYWLDRPSLWASPPSLLTTPLGFYARS